MQGHRTMWGNLTGRTAKEEKLATSVPVSLGTMETLVVCAESTPRAEREPLGFVAVRLEGA
jgi:hypothetical protein